MTYEYPLRQRQTPSPQASAPTRSDPASRSQPTAALFTIAAGCDRSIVDELPSSHARPKHLIDLRNHPIREPHTTPPTRDVAITARTQGSASGQPEAGDGVGAPATDFRRPADRIVLDLLFLQRHRAGARLLCRLPQIVRLGAAPAGLLVAMITVAAKRMITALKIKNLVVFGAG